MTSILIHEPESAAQLLPVRRPSPEELPRTRSAEDPQSFFATKRQRYDTRWKQQRNIAIRQEYTFPRLLVLYSSVGVLLIVLGILCYFGAAHFPKPIVIDYTNCKDNETQVECFSSHSPASPDAVRSEKCKCVHYINIEEGKFGARDNKILLFYELENFLQHARNYKRDVDWKQLEGKIFGDNGKALPLPKPEDRKCKEHKELGIHFKGKYTYPCGKIVNSYFSDVIKIFNDATGEEVKIDPMGIAWKSDKEKRFKNPKMFDQIGEHFAMPKDWHDDQKAAFLNVSGKGVEDERFIVWMRTASMKKFRKKYGYVKGIKPGKHRVEIDYRYEVKSFRGRKRIVIAVDTGSLPINLFFFKWFTGTGTAYLLTGPLTFCFNIIAKCCSKRRALKELKKRSLAVSIDDHPPDTREEEGEDDGEHNHEKIQNPDDIHEE